MTGRLPAALAVEAGAATARPVLLAHFDIAGAPVHVWSGVGNLAWAGATWAGVGTLGAVSLVEETVELRATGAVFRLSGVPADLIVEVAGAALQGRRARLWLGFMTEDWALVADPVLVFDGRMDTVEVVDGGPTALITLAAESRLRDLERPRTRRYTNEDQLAEFAGDLGFAFVTSLQDAEITWNRPVAS